MSFLVSQMDVYHRVRLFVLRADEDFVEPIDQGISLSNGEDDVLYGGHVVVLLQILHVLGTFLYILYQADADAVYWCKVRHNEKTALDQFLPDILKNAYVHIQSSFSIIQKNHTALRAVRISVLSPGGIAATPLVGAVCIGLIC